MSETLNPIHAGQSLSFAVCLNRDISLETVAAIIYRRGNAAAEVTSEPSGGITVQDQTTGDVLIVFPGSITADFTDGRHRIKVWAKAGAEYLDCVDLDFEVCPPRVPTF